MGVTQQGGVMEMDELVLVRQVKELARHFPDLKALPKIEIRTACFDEEENHGPAWLELNPPLEQGTICIDSRVSDFTAKTTKILILHELTHYDRYLKTGKAEDTEDEEFQSEIARLISRGAYNGLL
jgi:predicted SprT family Zn-dependent metalloprotease